MSQFWSYLSYEYKQQVSLKARRLMEQDILNGVLVPFGYPVSKRQKLIQEQHGVFLYECTQLDIKNNHLRIIL